MSGAINYNDIYDVLLMLNLAIYTPSNFILPSKVAKYIDLTHTREPRSHRWAVRKASAALMSINLLKRLESSVYAFRLTLQRIRELITKNH